MGLTRDLGPFSERPYCFIIHGPKDHYFHMGQTLNHSPGLTQATSDLQALFPSAEISWDAAMSPFMLTVHYQGATIRAFIERQHIEARDEMYETFKKGVVRLVTESLSESAAVRDWRLEQIRQKLRGGSDSSSH